LCVQRTSRRGGGAGGVLNPEAARPRGSRHAARRRPLRFVENLVDLRDGGEASLPQLEVRGTALRAQNNGTPQRHHGGTTVAPQRHRSLPVPGSSPRATRARPWSGCRRPHPRSHAARVSSPRPSSSFPADRWDGKSTGEHSLERSPIKAPRQVPRRRGRAHRV